MHQAFTNTYYFSFYIPSLSPPSPFKEMQSLLIESAPLSGRSDSNNNSQPPLAGRKPLTTRAAGAGSMRKGSVSSPGSGC